MSLLPSFYYIISCFSTCKVLVSVFDFVCGLVRKPVIFNTFHFFVAVLAQSKQKKIVVNDREFPSIVVIVIIIVGDIPGGCLLLEVIYVQIFFFFFTIGIHW